MLALTYTARDVAPPLHATHGNDRKPLPDLDLTDLAPLFVEWNAAQAKARDAYADARRRADCVLPHLDGRAWCVCRARRRS